MDFQQNISQGLEQIIGGNSFLTIRRVIVWISIIFSLGVYLAIVNNIDPDSELFRTFGRYFKTPTYKFYSGGEKGVYFAIVSTVASEINEKYSFNIDNTITSGGSENAIKVLTTPHSLGLVQEETIREGDFIREELNYITPLYIERMHIVLRVDPNNKHSKNFSYSNPPVLTSNTDEDVLKLFANSHLSTGPVGSGSIVIASHILSEINSQILDKNISENQTIHNLSMGKGLQNIQMDYSGDDQIDILFNIAGAPIRDVKRLLMDDRYMLISVDPSFVSKLNLKNGLNLRLTDFKHNRDGLATGVYPNSENVAAIGSYAWLISSRDVPGSDILDILEELKGSSQSIAKNLGIENPSVEQSPLREMNFLALYEGKYNRSNVHEWKSILIFLSTLSVSALTIFSFFMYIFSFRKQSFYFKEIVAIRNSAFPTNTKLRDSDYPVGERPSDIDLDYLRPLVLDNQKVVIDNIVIGIKNMLSLSININQVFQAGGLTNKSYSFLTSNVEETTSALREHLGRRMNEVIERGTELRSLAILDDLRVYYTAGYLMKNDYNELCNKANDLHISGD